jgi:polysaccharide pyruvyl transferase CsaB
MQMDIGGVETHVLELSKEMKRRGHDITVVSNGGVFEKELADSGIPHIKLPLHNKRPKNIKIAYSGLKELIKNGNFDLVHCHARIPAFLCGLLHKKLKFRFVTSAHWVFKVDWLLKLITNWGERTIAVSNDIRRYLIDNYKISSKNIVTTVNGIDTGKFSPETDFSDIAKEFSYDKKKLRIVYISRIDLDRSAVAFNLINIAEKLHKRHKNIEIVIVGGGNDYERLKETVTQVNKKIGKNIIITTGSRTDINKFIASTDVFVGVSRSVLEAMSSEKAVVIAGNEGFIGNLPDDNYMTAVATNFCCRGCPKTDDATLLADITKLLGLTREKRSEIGKNNRGIILEHYSAKKMADDHIGLYNDLLLYNPYKRDEVILSGYYGFNNSGDDAILKMILRGIRDRCSQSDKGETPNRVGITVFSNRPAEVRRIYKVNSVNRWNIFSVTKALKHSKLFISGGGSVIQDATSTKSLVYYLSLIIIAKMFHNKVMLYANGIGPVNKSRNKRWTKNVLNKADIITLREDDSRDVLNELGVVRPQTVITCDPVIGITEIDRDEVESLLYRYGLIGKKYILVSLRECKALPTFYNDLKSSLKSIKEKHGCELVFIPMQFPDDVEINKKYAADTGSVYINKRLTAEMCIGFAEKSEIAVSMRLHLIIYAFTAGVSSVGINYDPKIESVMRYFGQDTYLSVLEFTKMSFGAKVDRVILGSESYREDLIERLKELRVKNENNIELAMQLLNEE